MNRLFKGNIYGGVSRIKNKALQFQIDSGSDICAVKGKGGDRIILAAVWEGMLSTFLGRVCCVDHLLISHHEL